MECTPRVVPVESAVRNLAGSAGDPGYWHNLWTSHQAQLLNFGKAAVLALIVFVLAFCVCRIMRGIIGRAVRKIDAVDDSLGRLLIRVSNYIISFIAVLIILDLFGINTAGLVTVLGAAGLAVGLSLKDTLGNIAAGIVLIFNRPYRGGDYVECGSVGGTICEIGLFCTRLETPDGVSISVPNSAILAAPIKNYSFCRTRRMDIQVGISYSDSVDAAVAALQEMLCADARVLREPAPQVLVANLAESSVVLQLRLWTSNADFWNVQWDIRRQLKPVLESRGVHIPFPQLDVAVTMK